MYTVTYYSYKGGVGRTMALINTAVMLAQGGKRVLLVDFDLEAPGLTSFDMMRCARGRAGLVDYVSAYRATLAAPDVSEYIVHCPIDGGDLWVLPAGNNQEAGYAERLNSIDWERLYTHEHGYAMFEDLKQQWAGYQDNGFDYVLVDSRTGHTDVGGICTRQLPDAVVIMFLPNDQNIEGLVPIVSAIRSEERAASGEVTLHFCASNVPDEFDEDEVLEKLLTRAADELGYADRLGVDQPAAIIHHWSSLVLLDQPALVLARPKSRLTQEYGQLRTAVSAGNIADEDGALEAVALAKKELGAARRSSRSGGLQRLTRRGQEILRLHPGSGKVAWEVAQLFDHLREPRLEIIALTQAIDHGERPDDARLARALAIHNSRQVGDAVADLVAIFRSETATRFQLEPAFRILLFLDDSWPSTVAEVYRTPGLRFRAKLVLTEGVMNRRENLPDVVEDLTRLAQDVALDDRQRADARNNLILALIGSGHFDDAVATLEAHLKEDDVVACFNLAVARWGRDGSPPTDLFRRVVQLMDGRESGDANVNQCLALAHAVLRELDQSKALLASASELLGGALEFSCWRYLYATQEEMVQDLAGMSAALERGEALVPPFLSDRRSTDTAMPKKPSRRPRATQRDRQEDA